MVHPTRAEHEAGPRDCGFRVCFPRRALLPQKLEIVRKKLRLPHPLFWFRVLGLPRPCYVVLFG